MTEPLGYRLGTHVVTSSFEAGEGVLIDLDHRRYHSLNETAMAIVKALTDNTPRATLVSTLVKQYDVTEQTVQQSIDRTLSELASVGLITPLP